MEYTVEDITNNCRFCDSENIQNLFSSFFQCNDCDCIFKQKFNDEKKLPLIKDKSSQKSIFSEIINPIKMRFWHLISKEYVKYLQEKTNMKFKTALDVGALYGHFVKQLNDLGINTSGIEVEQNYINQDISGKVEHGYFDEHFHSDVKYDLICLTQMIYYVKNPFLVIKKTVELLNDSGMIFIATQNPNSTIIKQDKGKVIENNMNILLSKKNFQNISNSLNLKLVDFTTLRPDIYLDRLKGNTISEFINFLKYYKKPAYKIHLDGHHSFLLLQKTK